MQTIQESAYRETGLNFQQIIFALNEYWSNQGCVILQPYDMEVGAGTFHPATFLAAIGPEPTKSAYVQPSRRPTDGRYGENPNRLQHYFQYQVVLKPSPGNFQDLYLGSLYCLGIDPLQDDIRFVEDDWESPTLGAWGLGWEVWLNGMEITQVTYFQQAGGLECRPVTGEITYGLERIAMYVQGVDNVFDLKWNDSMTYGDLYLQFETEQSAFNFEFADTEFLFRKFDSLEKQCEELVQQKLAFPAYEKVLQASHTFNLLDARRMIGVTERARYIGRVRALARNVAEVYFESRENKGFPNLVDSPESESLPEHESGSVQAERFDVEGEADLLVEIGTEELPPDSVNLLGEALEHGLRQELLRVGLIENDERESKWYGTPRRIAAFISKVKRSRSDEWKERRGPPLSRAFHADGSPTAAGEGFAKSCGVNVSELEKVESGASSYLAYRYMELGKSADELIPECIEKAASKLPIAKRMRWGGSDAQFVRPIHWLLVLHGSRVVPCNVMGVQSSANTIGHRFHCPKAIKIRDAQEYLNLLKSEGKVVVDWEERKNAILNQIKTLEEQAKGKVVLDASLLIQVTNLVEWPEAFLGEFDQKFLKLPSEVLMTSMQHHQKYFPIIDSGGNLKPGFIGVSNIDMSSAETLERVRRGNERVLRARLADAEFFWEQDLKSSLEDKLPQLKHLVFHNRVGTVLDKVRRIEELTKYLARQANANLEDAIRAARLSKCDLVTELVGEFPELQGVAGRYYAIENGESPNVAVAIEESYQPRSAGDTLPLSLTGVIIAIADRIDSLIALTAAGEEAKGDKDPYSLRRMAISVIRLIIEKELDIDVLDLLHHSMSAFFADGGDRKSNFAKPTEKTIATVFEFILDRLKGYCLERGYTSDEFASVYELKPSRLLEFDKRLKAVRQFRELPEFENLVVANKRIRNILRTAKESVNTSVDPNLLVDASESSLNEQAVKLSKKIAPLIQASDHAGVLHELSVLREPIDRFFDDVMVMDENPDLRKNRIALVSYVNKLFLEVADISLLQPAETTE